VDLPPDFWVAAGVIVAAIGTIGAGIKWLTSRNQEKERDRIAREAHEITKKAFEANAIPQVTVDTYSAAYFRGYGTIPAGDYHALRPPDPFVVPIPMLIATAKNEGKVPVQIGKAGIRLERTGATIEVGPPAEDENKRPMSFPLPLPSRESIDIKLEAHMITRMLRVLKAEPEDQFTVWVAERVGNRYFSPPQQASDYLEGSNPFQVAINFEPPALVVEVGEEEYFPEGIFPLEAIDELPTKEPR